MPRKKQSRGLCVFCGKEFSKSGMSKHLKNCPERILRIEGSKSATRPTEKIWHLRVQDAYMSEYWLDLEMRGSAKLDDLDDYLRAIWLECCGHLSAFTIGGWGGIELKKSRKVNTVFKKDLVLRHLYDFGTTSKTDIRVVDMRVGKAIIKQPIALMARNLQPEALCQECGQPASWLCVECVYKEDKTGLLCDKHAKDHPHNDYGGLFRLFNSPRVGMCGYDGPAEPPY